MRGEILRLLSFNALLSHVAPISLDVLNKACAEDPFTCDTDSNNWYAEDSALSLLQTRAASIRKKAANTSAATLHDDVPQQHSLSGPDLKIQITSGTDCEQGDCHHAKTHQSQIKRLGLEPTSKPKAKDGVLATALPQALQMVFFSAYPSPLIRRPVPQKADPAMVVSIIVVALAAICMYKILVSGLTFESQKTGFSAESPCRILLWCMSGLLLFALATAALTQLWLQMPYVASGGSTGASGVIGYATWLLLVPFGLILWFTASLGILTNRTISGYIKALGLVLLVSCWALIFRVGITFARFSLSNGISPGINVALWLILVSSIFFVGFLIVLLTPLWLHRAAIKTWISPTCFGIFDGVNGAYPSSKVRRCRRRACHLCSSACLSLVLLPALFCLTTVLPNSFQFSSSSIAASMAQEVHTAEQKHALLVTMNVRLSNTVVMKIYPDTLMFYLFLEILALAAVAAVIFPSLGRYFSKRSVPMGFTNGEKSGMCLFGILLIFWVYYWLIDHAYGSGSASIDAWWSERVARTFGQTAVLMLSLLMLPASKNSLWLQALGISWERSLWLHRTLGYATLVCIAGHFSSFWARFAQLGSFPYDAFCYVLYYAVNSPTLTNSDKPSYTDWTIPIQQLIAYPSLFMIGIPVLMRHKNWELFKYFHFIFLALIPAVIMHAASAWYFMLGGIAFWLIDASIRFACVVTPPARLLQDGIVVHEVDNGYTELRMDWTHAEPGQFAWLKVPSISSWEWHPFSLSSGIDDGFAQMCIKNMGPGTFTDKLYQLAKKSAPISTTFDIQVDGPYGSYLDIADHGSLLLVAGGIGITQIHSTFRSISQLILRGESFAKLRSVHLVWIGKTENLFPIFADSIEECISRSGDDLQLSATFFHTRSEKEGSVLGRLTGMFKSEPIKLLSGRPSFADLYADGIQAAKGETLLVQACGPEMMVEAAAQAAEAFEQLVFESTFFRL